MATQVICADTLEEIEGRAGLSRGELREIIHAAIRESFAKEWAAGPLWGSESSVSIFPEMSTVNVSQAN